MQHPSECANCGTPTKPSTTEHPDQQCIYCTYHCQPCNRKWTVAWWADTNYKTQKPDTTP